MASGKSWLKGCGIGCGLMVVIVVAGTCGGGWFLMKPFQKAIESRQTLDETYGTQSEYRPPLDGLVGADRVETFLTVRTELMAHCAGFDEAFAQFRRMEELDEQGVSGRDKFREVVKTMGAGVGMAGKLGNLAFARNEALAAHGMGLGEYTYIYVLAYYVPLEVEDLEGGDVTMDDSSPRVRRVLRKILRHQLEDIMASSHPDRDQLREELAVELARLDANHKLYPWQEAVPARIDAALAPYRDRFEAVFCEATAPYALAVNRQRNGGLSITSD